MLLPIINSNSRDSSLGDPTTVPRTSREAKNIHPTSQTPPTGSDPRKHVANGVRGAQFKGSPTDRLLAAIRAVAAGGTAFAPEIRQLLDAASAVPVLSPRQREVLNALARGLTNDDIATLLGISTPRVKQLTKALYGKLGAANRAEAVARAMQHRLTNGF